MNENMGRDSIYTQVPVRKRRKSRRKLYRRLRAVLFTAITIVACLKFWSFLSLDLDDLAYLGAGMGSWFSDGDKEKKDSSELAETLSSDKYPQSLIELLKRNPETEQFVLDYPEKKDFSGKIDVSDEITKGEIPYFMQWDERWGYRKYGNDFMALNGCGPSCLSMVRCGLSSDKKWNPYKVAKMSEEEGYYVAGEGTSWTLMSSGAEGIGLTVHQVTFSEEGIRSALQMGQPIICVVGPGDFTTTGHYLVLVKINENGEVELKDPNSRKNSEKTWAVKTLMSQIRNLWAYSYEG